ncbi:MAG TPA: four helix bundle protein [Vicinamibacteria bacterium]|nr:four helix bundle protein [Vicinamibacteria bacterium]
MKNFRDLKAGAKAHDLALRVYRATDLFPARERYGLADQMRRAGVSVSCNIAEGCGRSGDAEFRRFLDIAMGSASELECQVLLARDLGYLDQQLSHELEADVVEVKRMLASLIRRLRC